MKISVFIALLLAAASSFAGSFCLFSDTLDLSVGNYRYVKFRITPDQALNARITGEFSTLPDSIPVELLLLTEYNYRTAWDTMQPVDTLAGGSYYPGQLVVDIPDFGDFVLIISNRGNYSPIQFSGEMKIEFEGSGITYDALPTGMTVLITVFAAGLVIAAIVITVKKLG
ncbi:hypothetical protein CSA37_08025 [Candidatus Fermentibacteria bacterium]|nr:MAG: hypothetical protein CSA37_08025 [Candidatus Fermentibacteria bacterium]